MELKVNDKKIGELYCNLAISKDCENYRILSEKIKKGEAEVSIGDAKFIIEEYRTTYTDDMNLYIEGAKLIFK